MDEEWFRAHHAGPVATEAEMLKMALRRLGYGGIYIKEHEHAMTVYAVGLGLMERELKHGEGAEFLQSLPDLTRPEPKSDIIERLCRVSTPFERLV
jgi:hypothetical protein